jgi:hypothetical protein
MALRQTAAQQATNSNEQGAVLRCKYIRANDEQALLQTTFIEPWPKVSADVLPEPWVDLEHMRRSIERLVCQIVQVEDDTFEEVALQ